MLVDKHFTFFQIETKLRDIVHQMTQSIKEQLHNETTKTSGFVGRVDQLERKLTEQNNEIKKNDYKWKQFDVIRDEIRQVMAYVDEKNETIQKSFSSFEDFVRQKEDDARAERLEIRAEMKCIYDYKKELIMYNKKFEEYKEQMNKRIENDIHLFSLEVAEIRQPQAYMQAMLESNNKQLQ